MTLRAGHAGVLPHLLLLAMIAIWGGSYASVKVALDTVSPFAVIASRFWLAVLCLLPFVLRSAPGSMALARGKGLITGAALLTGYALQTVGMTETTASMGGFLSGLIVLLVAIGGVLFLGARMRSNTVLGLCLGLAGLVPLCMTAADPTVQTNTLRGVLLQVGSSTSYAAHILLVSRLSPRGGELQYCLWQLLVVAIGATALQLGVDGVPEAAPWREPLLLWNVAYLGVFATALGIAVQSRVQPRIPPTHVAGLFALQPVFAAIAGSLFLHDQLGPRQLLGGALIVIGVLVVGLRR
jgi:drug/metabolite transporter (DMT)-like permease